MNNLYDTVEIDITVPIRPGDSASFSYASSKGCISTWLKYSVSLSFALVSK
jgi:hypothetical protein